MGKQLTDRQIRRKKKRLRNAQRSKNFMELLDSWSQIA
jgi:hypothetical protein